jgi:ergothioneine biosynthesis protein EgtB
MRTLGKTELRNAMLRARQYTSALVVDLDDAQWRVPQLDTVNPTLWEVGHVGWFMEHWCLRWRGQEQTPAASILEHADRWYDSRMVAHSTRWVLDLPSRAATLRYLDDVMDATLQRLEQSDDDPAALYFFQLALYHEDMHAEAFAYTRQTCAYPAPTLARDGLRGKFGDDHDLRDGRDVQVDRGTFLQGAPREVAGFAFDNEKCGHDVELAPFSIARRPVTSEEFAAFVDDGGYARTDLWSSAGQAWLTTSGVRHPVYWRRGDDSRWQGRQFDRWQPIDARAPMVHVNCHEATAWCRWAQRRLPTESEWERAALAGAITPSCVWEWTGSTFRPYPGFQPDAYAEYSAPWFHTHISVRGASAATPERIGHPKFRNFYTPERSDIFVGFRTCAES